MEACESNEQLTSLLNDDQMLNVLMSIGYRGIPSKETLQTRNKIIRYAVKNVQNMLLILFVSNTLFSVHVMK